MFITLKTLFTVLKTLFWVPKCNSKGGYKISQQNGLINFRTCHSGNSRNGLFSVVTSLYNWVLCSLETVHYAIHAVLKLLRLRDCSGPWAILGRAVLKLFIMISMRFQNCSRSRNCSALWAILRPWTVLKPHGCKNAHNTTPRPHSPLLAEKKISEMESSANYPFLSSFLRF